MIVSYTPIAEVAANLVADLRAEARSRVVHRQHGALDLESRVEVVGDEADRGQELPEALEREVLALDRDERGVRRRQGVDREQAERWRAVDEDVVVAGPGRDRGGRTAAARAAPAA